MRRVTGLNFVFSSPSVISILLLTSPSIVIFHVSGSLLSSGIVPLLRTKNFSVGVVSSSSRFSGVSATSGRSPSSTSLSLLPGNFRYCGPFGAAGARRRALRQRRGDQAARHVGGERNRAADGGAHRREARAAEKAAPVDAGFAAERFGVGALGVVRVEFFDRCVPVSWHCLPADRRSRPRLDAQA